VVLVGRGRTRSEAKRCGDETTRRAETEGRYKTTSLPVMRPREETEGRHKTSRWAGWVACDRGAPGKVRWLRTGCGAVRNEGHVSVGPRREASGSARRVGACTPALGARNLCTYRAGTRHAVSVGVGPAGSAAGPSDALVWKQAEIIYVFGF
jgi:hypothetical protein